MSFTKLLLIFFASALAHAADSNSLGKRDSVDPVAQINSIAAGTLNSTTGSSIVSVLAQVPAAPTPSSVQCKLAIFPQIIF
jgi:hypothetical protein